MKQPDEKIQRWLPFTLLLLLGFIWGTGYSIARFAVTNGVNPLGYSFWQSLGPALIMSLFAYKKNNFQWDSPRLRYYFVCGLTGIALPNTNMYFAASHLPAGLLSVIVNTVPIFAYIMALLARIEKFNSVRLVAVGLAFFGLLLILLPRAGLPTLQMIPWTCLALISPISFAFCSVYIARFRPAHCDSINLAAGTLIFSSIILFPFIIYHQQFYMFHLPLTHPDLVILLEIMLSTLGYILFFKLLRIAGPVYYSFVDTIVAVTGLFWGYIIFHEKLNELTATAVVAILLALILITRQKHITTK